MLDEMKKTISMAQLAKNVERIATDIERTGTVYRIRRPGHRSMLLVDRDYIEGLKVVAELDAMHPRWREEIVEGRREVAQGHGIPIEVALAELGLADPAAHPKRLGKARKPSRSRRAKGRARGAHAARST
jgi:hypothetical protein